MEQFKKLRRMTMAVGLMAIISMIFTVPALSDIIKGIEPDLSTEWSVVRLSLFLITLFIGLTMTTMWHAKKRKV